MGELKTILVTDISFVKELYPRLKEDDETIERYRASIDKLPPISVANGRVLVDGYHRWQAHKREGLAEVTIDDIGNLTDAEIFRESIRRNSSHGRQLDTRDKRRNADLLYRKGGLRDYEEIAAVLSITVKTAKEYCRDARRDEVEEQKQKAWDLWLDCWTQEKIAQEIGVSQKAISDWLVDFQSVGDLLNPPASRQHFDVWQFQTADKDAGSQSYFGAIPPQIVENLLWLYTEPGNIVVDPFAGSGTTIDVAKKMGRRIWASDRKGNDYAPLLPIHQHDIVTGWHPSAPKKADFIILDPPYWMQARGRYSDDSEDLGNMSLDQFIGSWIRVIKLCKQHLTGNGKIAYIISPAEDKDNDRVIDLAWQMFAPCLASGFHPHRRIIATYNTQQATGQQVQWAKDNKKLLKLYRDIVVMNL